MTFYTGTYYFGTAVIIKCPNVGKYNGDKYLKLYNIWYNKVYFVKENNIELHDQTLVPFRKTTNNDLFT